MANARADLSKVRTYRLRDRHSLVQREHFVGPQDAALPPTADITRVAEAIAAATDTGSAVIWHLGGHVIKRGLAPVIIDLMERGAITHVASNGAAAIHDYEIALQGQTSEDVATSIEDGSFGMAEETGAEMNAAIKMGAADGLGCGEALGRWLDSSGAAHLELSVLHAAYRLGIPYTVHAAIGTDIIHQHPSCDFAAVGGTSGTDFKALIASVASLDGGVFCNFGSAVIGPEVFLKALSVARNLGHHVAVFTTANFDLVSLAAPTEPSTPDEVEYYYRPKKNVLIRPVSLGGAGVHVVGDHSATIPSLAAAVRERVGPLRRRDAVAPTDGESLTADYPLAAEILRERVSSIPELAHCAEGVTQAFRLLRQTFAGSGTLFVCGNGGSHADAAHITGELNKSMEIPRPLPPSYRDQLNAAGAPELAQALQGGLRTVTLGTNAALTSAICNDIEAPAVELAQELYALARPGDVLLALSTSGRSANVVNACQVARTRGVSSIALTGGDGGRLRELVDILICAPGADTPTIQHSHRLIYHALCAMLERQFFGTRP